LREDDSVAAQVLIHLGVNLESVRKEMTNLLGHSLMSPGSRTKKIEPGDAPVETTFKLDESDGAKWRDMFSPAYVDQLIRQAIQFCWMSLPKERRTVDELEAQIQRLVDRAMRDFREDSQQFGTNGPSTAP
jgi:hypothetical protein